MVSRLSPWRQGRAVLFVSWISGASLVFGRLLVVLQVGPLLVLGTLAFEVLVLLGLFRLFRWCPLREFCCVRVLGVFPGGVRTVDGAEGGVQRVLVRGACLISYSRCCAFLSSSSLVRLHLFQKSDTIFVLLGRPRRGRCRISADGTSGATPSTMPTLLRAEVVMLGFCQAGRPVGLRIVRQDCHGRIAYSLFSCGFWHAFRLVRCVACGTLFRLLPTPSVGVVPMLAQRPRCLRRRFVALRPFCWVPWCFLLRFGRLLHLLWRRQCASLLHVINSFHCRFDALQDSQVEEHTGIFSHIRTRSSLAVLREVTTLLWRQERKITPRCVSAGGSPDQDLYSAKKKITAIAEQTFSGN